MSVVLFNVDNSREGRWFRVSGSYGCVLENVCCHVAMMLVECLISKQKFTNSLWTVNKKLLRKQTQVGIQRLSAFQRCLIRAKETSNLIWFILIQLRLSTIIICMKVNWFSKQKVNASNRGCFRLLFGFNINKGKVKNGELKTDCSQLTTPLKNKNRPIICVHAMFTTGYCQIIQFLTLSLARNALKLLLIA